MMSFYPVQMGPNNQFFWLAQELSHHSVKVTVISTDMGFEKESEIERNSFISTDYGSIIYCSDFSSKFPYFSNAQYRLDAARELSTNGA